MDRCASIKRICDAEAVQPASGAFGVVAATKNGGGTWRGQRIHGLGGVRALSCPTTTVCFGLSLPFFCLNGCDMAAAGRIAETINGGNTWQVVRIAAYPFNALACPTVRVCYVDGFLGRLMRSADGGTTWHDLIPAIFVSGTYGATQPLHTYSDWFTATQPWRITVGRPGIAVHAACTDVSDVTIFVRDAGDQVVAGPIHIPLGSKVGGSIGTATVQSTGKLRLDVVSHCSSFNVRVDGVG
jgi:hypothetical protein